MATFNIGCLFTHDNYVLNHLSSHLKNIIAYGGVNCLWHGGRYVKNTYSLDDIEHIISLYNINGIPCRFTFSNHKITEEDLNDELSNYILDILAKNEINGVIISSDLLYEYIRNKYPKMKIICSVIKTCVETSNWANETPDIYNSLCEKYDCVVLNPARNKDICFLSELKYKDKIEILLNNECIKFCKNASTHYNLILDTIRNDLKNINSSTVENEIYSIVSECSLLKHFHKNITCFTPKEQYYELVNMGFNHFKLEGRTNNLIAFSNDLNYYFNLESK